MTKIFVRFIGVKSNKIPQKNSILDIIYRLVPLRFYTTSLDTLYHSLYKLKFDTCRRACSTGYKATFLLVLL